MTEPLEYFAARALEPGQGGTYALVYALLRLAGALEELAIRFTPATPSFEHDLFAVRVGRRLDELSKQLDNAVARLLPPDPPEAAEFLPRRRRPPPTVTRQRKLK